ncbi:hypothetical protein ACU635_44000 [[Actinomadura] parvosata]|uniref:hypothetical protein n=1 Tax=[Actinomadura] parvosata TaxID=1955412 RepID=UPI00406C3F67
MTAIPVLPELPTGGYRTTHHLPPEVLNSEPYRRPGAVLTYPTTISTVTRPRRTEPVSVTLTVVHVEGCQVLAQVPADQRGQWTGTGEDMHFAMRFGPTEEFTWCEACMSHRLCHVVLPSGERRYRPAAPVGVAHQGDPAWPRFAVAATSEDGGWYVATWTVALAEAEFIAQGWPTMAVVLDPGQWPSEEAA